MPRGRGYGRRRFSRRRVSRGGRRSFVRRRRGGIRRRTVRPMRIGFRM